jgi:osmoprotectant transport system substrate-binding protein
MDAIIATLARITSSILLLVSLAAVSSASAQTLTVGGKNFTEQHLVAEMTSQLLEAKGIPVTRKVGFSTTGVRKELEAGLVDIYWEYTGTSLMTFNNVRERLGSDEAYDRVAQLDAEKGLIWLSPSGVNNTYALAMRRADATARGIGSISDLAERIRQGETFRFACNTEFFIRPDGLMPIQRAYQFEFGPTDVVRMETAAVYDFLRHGSASDVGLVFSTDGRVPAFDLLLLEDDRAFFPAYLLTPVVRKLTLDEYPDVAGYLNALSAKLDNPTMARLNAQVDLDNRPVEDVAASFLRASGFL